MAKPKKHWEVDFSQWTKERATRLSKAGRGDRTFAGLGSAGFTT